MKCMDQIPAPSEVDAKSSQTARVRPFEMSAQRALRRATKEPRQATKYETAGVTQPWSAWWIAPNGTPWTGD